MFPIHTKEQGDPMTQATEEILVNETLNSQIDTKLKSTKKVQSYHLFNRRS